jgi:effector-binding domain-containing protein
MDIAITEVPSQLVAMERKTIPMDGFPEFFDRVFGEVIAAVNAARGTVAGPPFGWYHGMPADTADVAAGFPVGGMAEGPLQGDIAVVQRPGGRAAVAMHVGPYETLAQSYEQVQRYIAEHDELVPRDEMWEEYLTDPEAEPDPATWQTRIVQPLQ